MVNGFDMELLKRMFFEDINSPGKKKTKILYDYCTNIKCKTAIKRFNRYYLGKWDKVKIKTNRAVVRKKRYNSIHRDIIKLIWELAGKDGEIVR